MIRDSHPELEVRLDDQLKYIGYWSSGENPLDYADSTWDPAEREAVFRYLSEAGSIIYYWAEPVACKICGRRNGSRCLTDGEWVWPSGLIHYISKHSIRLPEEFVAHVMSKGFEPLGKMGEGKVRALVEMIGGDPDKEVASLEKMRAFGPMLDGVRDMVRGRDLLVLTHMQNIIKSTCAVMNYIGEDFDPILMRGIVALATGIAANEESVWSQYVKEGASLANLRIISDNLPPSGEYDA